MAKERQKKKQKIESVERLIARAEEALRTARNVAHAAKQAKQTEIESAGHATLKRSVGHVETYANSIQRNWIKTRETLGDYGD